MIVTNRVSGPSFSTDSTAAALSGFLTAAARPAAVRGAAGSPVQTPMNATDMAQLYPSIFAAGTPARGIAAAVRAAFASLRRRRPRLFGAAR